MTPRNSIPALAISFALLGLVAWMAAAYPGSGSLFAANPPQAASRTIAETVVTPTPRAGDVR